MVKMVTVKMPEWMVMAIDDYARKHGLTRSEVIRKAIIHLLGDEISKHKGANNTHDGEYIEEIILID